MQLGKPIGTMHFDAHVKANMETKMASATISIEVDSETARAFTEATEEDRRKLQLLLKLRLRELTSSPARSLTQIMDDMGREAEERGLTPEILESLRNGE